MSDLLKRFFIVLFLSGSLFSGNTLAEAGGAINTLEKTGLLGKFKPSGIAIRGYDTVAYFTQGKPVQGSEQFKVDWQGAQWRFASQQHADLFAAEPDKYAPQYGGYCAYGVAQGYLVKIEPEQWRIVDDKLYLNYDRKVQKNWLEDVAGYIASADEKFSGLLKNSE